MLARARQVAPQSYATLASTAGTRLAALLSLRYRYVWCSLWACQLVFFFQAFAQSSPAATLAPKPFKVSLRSIFFIGVNRRLLLGSPAGREGVVLSQFLLCYVSFLLLPPLFHRCGSIRFFRASFRSAATYLQPKGELVFHSLHYVPPIPLRSIKLHYIHSFRQALLRPRKRNFTPRKNIASTPEAATVLIALRYTPHSLSATIAPLATASPYTSAAGKALRYRYAAFPPPRCSRLLSLTLGKEVFRP